MKGNAPARFGAWLNGNVHEDPKTGLVYMYHSRSDSHSVALCQFIVEDLYAGCALLQRQFDQGKVVYDINARLKMPRSGREKTEDLAIGTPLPDNLLMGEVGKPRRGKVKVPLLTCEAKTVMTEHGKSKPRVFDELSSSHEIIHNEWPEAIATGITTVNIAESFVSPLRNQTPKKPVFVTKHKQPKAAKDMVEHLRKLRMREGVAEVGFDAYSSIVVSCDNASREAAVWDGNPAPLTGDQDHYDTFLSRIVAQWGERFANL